MIGRAQTCGDDPVGFACAGSRLGQANWRHPSQDDIDCIHVLLHAHRALPNSAATADSTAVPLKKSGFIDVYISATFENTNFLKSSRVMISSSTSSCVSLRTFFMSGTSQWPMSELNIAFNCFAKWFTLRSNAITVARSSPSHPK